MLPVPKQTCMEWQPFFCCYCDNTTIYFPCLYWWIFAYEAERSNFSFLKLGKVSVPDTSIFFLFGWLDLRIRKSACMDEVTFTNGSSLPVHSPPSSWAYTCVGGKSINLSWSEVIQCGEGWLISARLQFLTLYQTVGTFCAHIPECTESNTYHGGQQKGQIENLSQVRLFAYFL